MPDQRRWGAAVAVGAALLLGGCTSGATAAGPTRVTVPSSPLFDTAYVEKAHGFLTSHREQIPKHWQRAIVAATGTSGPSDHLRWDAIVVWADGTLGSLTSEFGTSNSMNLLVQRGDYLWVHAIFGTISPDTTKVRQKAALSP